MKKRFFLATLLGLSLVAAPALADRDDWFKKYDHNHAGEWDYNDFCAWEKAHHRHLSDRQLREMYDRYDANHDGFWQREEAHKFHH